VFSERASWDLTPSTLAERVGARRARGLPVLDLADGNAAHAGLREPARALAAALEAVARDPASLGYEPDPRGEPSARAAVARWHRRAGAPVAPDHVVLTAGTSEGYAHLFRLLADPGNLVHLPAPGYGLFEHLAALEGVATSPYPLRPPPAREARWRIDVAALARSLGPRSRAVLLIHPHNPTGSYVDPDDLSALRALARQRELAIVSDEVFADPTSPSALVDSEAGPLHFVLGGASKALALPQLKLAWIVVAGPEPAREEALARLEFVADAYLSVSPLLARALPALFERQGAIADELRARIAGNRARLQAALAGSPLRALPAEAGWAAILRIPGEHDEEKLALGLLDRAGVLVQPGFVFDLEPRDAEGGSCGHLVVSLLGAPDRFDEGARSLAAVLSALFTSDATST
jgi:aspartate/methionine/tyrosine aminotransferase